MGSKFRKICKVRRFQEYVFETGGIGPGAGSRMTLYTRDESLEYTVIAFVRGSKGIADGIDEVDARSGTSKSRIAFLVRIN